MTKSQQWAPLSGYLSIMVVPRNSTYLLSSAFGLVAIGFMTLGLRCAGCELLDFAQQAQFVTSFLPSLELRISLRWRRGLAQP